MVTENLPPVSKFQAGAHLVYLDQWVWVNLAKAASAAEGGVYADLLDRLRQLRSSGRIVLPLAAGNYLELLHRRSSKSRREVAKIMASLSGYATLRAIHLVQAEEVRLAANWVGDPSAPPTTIDRSFILGTGANHAFGSRWGRWRFVETSQPDGPDDGPETEPPEDFRTLAMRLPVEQREWLNLVGADEDYNLTGIDYRPGHRLGDEFARLQDRTRQFANDVPNDGSLLYRAVVLGQLKGLEDHIRGHLSAAEMDRFFAGPVRGAAFVAAVPTRQGPCRT